jgi:hypothetical protein
MMADLMADGSASRGPVKAGQSHKSAPQRAETPDVEWFKSSSPKAVNTKTQSSASSID